MRLHTYTSATTGTHKSVSRVADSFAADFSLNIQLD